MTDKRFEALDLDPMPKKEQLAPVRYRCCLAIQTDPMNSRSDWMACKLEENHDGVCIGTSWLSGKEYALYAGPVVPPEMRLEHMKMVKKMLEARAYERRYRADEFWNYIRELAEGK